MIKETAITHNHYTANNMCKQIGTPIFHNKSPGFKEDIDI